MRLPSMLTRRRTAGDAVPSPEVPEVPEVVGDSPRGEEATEPEDPGKTEDPGEAEDSGKPEVRRRMPMPGWAYPIVRAGANFLAHRATDLAAALTYYAVLAVGPALIALVSTLALLGRSEQVVAGMLRFVGQLAPQSTVDELERLIKLIASSPSAGLGLLLGLAGALWSSSVYVGAFGRAMNVVFEVEEGRPYWKLRPQMFLVTIVVLALVVVGGVALVLSGPIAVALGEAIGLTEQTVRTWNTVKWPIVLLLVMAVVALLYYATPNVKRPRVRLLSAGAVVAILTWVVASTGFGYYVSNFGTYNTTYGSLGGLIVFLLWLWITNMALVFGAELDAEIERRHQLDDGIPAEESLQLELRDESAIEKRAEQRAGLIAMAHVLREPEE